MGELVIRINGRIVERIIYWVIIILLIALLVWSYLGNAGCEPTTQTEDEDSTVTGNTVNDDGGSNVEVINTGNDDDSGDDGAIILPEETCDDTIKNQDETDVDCGGSCDGCAEGDSCDRDSDCNDGTCESGKCESEPELSGKLEITVTDVKTKVADGTGAIKVESFKVKVVNGKSDNVFLEAEGYVKTLGGSYLSQYTEEIVPYIGPVDLGKIGPGETKTVTVDEAGTYVATQTGYDTGDDFNFVIEFYDDGEKIDQTTKKVRG